MMRRTFIKTLAFAVGLTAAGAAWGLEEVRIGATLPMTGDAASYGEWMHNGMSIAIEEIQERWGDERRLVVIFEDSKSSPRDAVTAMNKLISADDVHAVMTTLTGVTKAQIPVAEQNKIVLTTSATLPGLAGESDYLFRNSTNLSSEISRLVEFASKRYKTAAVLWANLEWANWGSQSFAEGFEKSGGRIVENQSFPSEASDVRAQLTRIRAAQPEVLLILAYRQTGVAMRQARELGVDAQFLGTLDFELPDVLEIAQQTAEGAIYTKAAFDPENPSTEAAARYTEKYAERFGAQPEVYSATMYDMLHMLAEAVVEANGHTDGVRERLLSIENYPGASGETTFLPDGDVDKPVELKVIKGGEYQLFEE